MKTSIKPGVAAVSVLIAGLTQPIAALAQQPRIELFPTTVAEDIREAGQAAEAMEANMMPAYETLSQNMDNYRSAKCEGSVADEGCRKLQRAVSESYSAYLDAFSEHVPDIRTSMQNTMGSLGANIRSEMGRKRTPRDLEGLLKDGRGVASTRAAEIRTRAGRQRSRMSAMINNYAKLLSSPATAQQAEAVLAAEFYVDAYDVVTQLDRL